MSNILNLLYALKNILLEKSKKPEVELKEYRDKIKAVDLVIGMVIEDESQQKRKKRVKKV